MRLQLTLVFLCSSILLSYSQNDSSYRIKDVDAYFLMHYYNQNGVHSAVEGGAGSEKLNDVESKIIVNLLVDTNKMFGLKLGINHYTSASTDKIDFRMSSASRKDNRAQIEISHSRFFKKFDLSFYGGASIESDYISTMLGAGFQKEFQNSSISINNRSYFDNWVMIFPIELRSRFLDGFSNSRRISINNSVSIWKALSKRFFATIDVEFIFQSGLLSTPFHRVYFDNDSLGVERLPDRRLRFPITLKASYFPSESLRLQFLYRYYIDDFKIQSHTSELSLPIKILNRWSFEPSYRFYYQRASDYFQVYGEHEPFSEFHTSDYDLSEFVAHKLGATLGYQPIWTLYKKKDGTIANLRQISLRYSYYSREDGLFYHVVSSSIQFKL